MKKEVLQWHPAFFAGLQIELEEEKDNLIFENEHQLGTKPKEIDVLIIKKEKDIPVRKNIGRIFRKHNIVEYKSPADYLSIDDFYKVYAYACFYKADTPKENSIPITDITITFVCQGYPRKLIKHLKKVWNYQVVRQEAGIYLIDKRMAEDVLPMQIIVPGKLGKKENLWLSSLTNELTDKEGKRQLVEEYQRHSDNILYESVMDVVVRANEKEFEEVKGMCKALEELMADVIEERVAEQVEQRVAEQLERRVEEQLEQRVAEQVEQRVAEQVEQRVEERLEQRVEEQLEQRIEEQLEQRVTKRLEQRVAEQVEQGMKNIVYNLIKRKMSDADICAITECAPQFVEMVRKLA